MFDLETAIATWRQSLKYNRAFRPEDLEELERHIRDHVDTATMRGASPEEAFREACSAMGQYGHVESEFRKVYWGTIISQNGLYDEVIWRWTMFLNYMRVALRNVKRHPGFALLNVGGLAVGLAVCALIFLFVQHELAYDQFHEKANRTFRVVLQGNIRLMTSGALAPALRNEFPEVENAVRVSHRWSEVLIQKGDESTYFDTFYFVDSTFFDMFDFRMLAGDPETALQNPFAVVITANIAARYFGDQDPIGETLNIKGLWDAHDFTVTGVVENPSGISHFPFEFLAPFSTRFTTEPSAESIESWGSGGPLTYVTFLERESEAVVSKQMTDFFERHEAYRFRNRPQADLENYYSFQPLTDIHLRSHLEDELALNGDIKYLYLFGGIAVLVLLIACINYVNLATARSAARAREVGIRKVAGAFRHQLVMQFMGESFVVFALAIVIGLALAAYLLPYFGQLIDRPLEFELWTGIQMLLTMMALGTVVGILSGFYPAVVLSGFEPVRTLKGQMLTSNSSSFFRNGLVVGQFCATIILIVVTIIIQHQLEFMHDMKLGMNPDQVLVLNTHGALDSKVDDTLKEELLRHSNIVNVSSVSRIFPINTEPYLTHIPEPLSIDEDQTHTQVLSVDENFIETMQIYLTEGRDLRSSDIVRGLEETPVLINEAAVQAYGWDRPIGQQFKCCFNPVPTVVGVVENFHFQSLRSELTPVAIQGTPWSRNLIIRVLAGDLENTLEYVEEKWSEFAPGLPLDVTYMDDHFKAAYTAERRLAQSFLIFSGLAIVIACLGLLGLVSFMAQQRTKEIGVRKVLGATTESVLMLLTKDFLLLVAFAFAIAAPLSYYLGSGWLDEFPYRIDVGLEIFAITAILVLVVAVGTTSVLSIRAASANPIDCIRYE